MERAEGTRKSRPRKKKATKQERARPNTTTIELSRNKKSDNSEDGEDTILLKEDTQTTSTIMDMGMVMGMAMGTTAVLGTARHAMVSNHYC